MTRWSRRTKSGCISFISISYGTGNWVARSVTQIPTICFWRGAAQGEAGLKFKAILFRLAVQVDLELGVEGEEGDAHRRRHDAHALGDIPHHDRGRLHRVGGRVDHRHSARAIRVAIRDIDVLQ